MSAFGLVQLNIGIIKGAMDSPVMADFAANLDRINALADGAPDFVWRLQTEDGDATGVPARRLGIPDDIAATIVFLASAKADFSTGQVIGVNGGKTAL